MSIDEQDSGATIDPSGLYRYRLWRSWGEGPSVLWILLNPSTADHQTNDPTIRRCIEFSIRWGYHGIEVVNLFAWRATSPSAMKSALDPVGPLNDRYIVDVANQCDLVVAGWGVHGAHKDRDKQVIRLFEGFEIKCLGKTRDGHPRHPLYLPYSAVLSPL